jgi:hypothetical protein
MIANVYKIQTDGKLSTNCVLHVIAYTFQEAIRKFENVKEDSTINAKSIEIIVSGAWVSGDILRDAVNK